VASDGGHNDGGAEDKAVKK